MKINIEELKKYYDDQLILDIQKLELDHIRTLAIVGPSGGGKTTLLKILATIEEAQAKTLEVNNIPVLEEAYHKEYLKEVGYVFQTNNLFPHLTVLENVTLHLIYTYGMEKQQAITLAQRWLEKVNLLEHQDKKPSQISGGQAQRAAIVRALVTGASLLLLDEPTSALDPKLAYEVMQTLIKLKEESDIVIVTHELNFARRFAEYYLFVDEGKLLGHGPIEELFDSNNEVIQSFVNMIEFK
ncbi:MAG: amino acid ABC transporter ATP-binding protein [Cellulosilyticaceae bacterium]